MDEFTREVSHCCESAVYRLFADVDVTRRWITQEKLIASKDFTPFDENVVCDACDRPCKIIYHGNTPT